MLQSYDASKRAIIFFWVKAQRYISGLVNRFLSWGVFTSLARINYMVFLFHLGVINMFFAQVTYSIYATDIVVVIQFCDFFVSSY